MKSLSYYLTLLIIKIKGVKRDFSNDPVDYQRLRKGNVASPDPKKFRPHSFRKFFVAGAEISEIIPERESDSLLLFCHGGAFIYGPVDYHWDAAKTLVIQTESTVWMVNYPKAPEKNIQSISQNINKVYAAAVEKFPLKKVILIGDSVGGTLFTALVQRLIISKERLPVLLVLISPVMDASFSNREIFHIDKVDPILSRAGALSAKKMAAAGLDLKDPLISPLYANFEGFPKTLLFIAENDITSPDQELAAQKMRKQEVDLEVIFGKGMPHIWPILPVMTEAKNAFSIIISKINKSAQKDPAIAGPGEAAKE